MIGDNGIIGRLHEQRLLEDACRREQAQLIAVYGRRRVGKTFLVRQYFGDSLDFCFTGSYQTTAAVQLRLFARELASLTGGKPARLHTWFDAFAALREYIETLGERHKTVFIDEIPWLDTPRSNFLAAFSYFWNSWASLCPRLTVVVCGSATTWMLDRFVGDKGGLYGRTNRCIYLAPLSLGETEQFLAARSCVMTRQQTAELYMTLGGIPYYLDMIDPALPLAANIDALFFAPDAPLKAEYEFLFRTLFREAKLYRAIVETLASKAKGMTQAELKTALDAPDGGTLTTALRNLQKCDFIRSYAAIGKKARDTTYQLTDLFTLFHLRFAARHNGRDEHYWTNMPATRRAVWEGYAFEMVCLHHLPQIKRRLGVAGVQTNACCWHTKPLTDSDGTHWPGAQIDLLLERADGVTNLCEMKFATAEYAITAEYDDKLRERTATFAHHTRTKDALPVTFVTTYGLKTNAYSQPYLPRQVLLDDLFEPA